MTHVITSSCCADAACTEVCPVDCIRPRPGDPTFLTADTLHIDPATCIDCGACTDVCPVDAIEAPDLLAADVLSAAGQASLAESRAFFGRFPLTPAPARASSPTTTADRAPLRVAVVGTGPSGYYAALEVLTRTAGTARITMIEKSPAVGGLIHHGVAPDHVRTKRFARGIERFVRRPQVQLLTGVEVGRHIGAAELLREHHAVIHAVGAAQDRALGIAGEDLPGSHPAGRLAAWYNGHPDEAGRRVDLSHPRAVVIGNGNVALDVARILTTDPDELARTTIAAPALAALRGSAVREVHVVGRRDPSQAAFTVPELLGLDQLDGVQVLVPPEEARCPPTDPGHAGGRKARTVADWARRTPDPARRRILLRFHRSPVAITGDRAVAAVRLTAPDGGTEEVGCGLLVRAVGHRGAPVPGLPFDAATATVPSDAGRVLDPTSGAVTGHYVVGWLKRGPQGGIGRSRLCAAETVTALLADHEAGLLADPPTAVAARLDPTNLQP